jgi:hypothetical protein
MTYLLRHIHDPSDGIGKWCAYTGPHYLVRLGEQWHIDPRFRLIQETTPDRAKAKRFDTEEDARSTIAQAGSPKGWEVVPAL